MPIRTRAEMHIGLDLALEVLDATPMNRLDPPVKDYFLNRTISEFVKDVVTKANKPNESKEVLSRIPTLADSLNKYNDIYTLVTLLDTTLASTAISPLFNIYSLPTNLFRFECSFSHVRWLSSITYSSATIPTLAAVAGAGVTAGLHYYFVTFVYPAGETDIIDTNVTSITVVSGANQQVNLSTIPVGVTGCTARKIYRSKLDDPWYSARLLTTIGDNVTTTYSDNTADAALGAVYAGNTNDTILPNILLNTYDITFYNTKPLGLYLYPNTITWFDLMASAIIGNGTTSTLRIYHLNKYAINRTGIIYIKKPAILTSSPGIVNCDLPESVHDRIVDDTAKFIAAATSSGNYEQLLMEAKQQSK